jgi:hypothetical protein
MTVISVIFLIFYIYLLFTPFSFFNVIKDIKNSYIVEKKFRSFYASFQASFIVIKLHSWVAHPRRRVSGAAPDVEKPVYFLFVWVIWRKKFFLCAGPDFYAEFDRNSGPLAGS